jgi:hypothetical protein
MSADASDITNNHQFYTGQDQSLTLMFGFVDYLGAAAGLDVSDGHSSR